LGWLDTRRIPVLLGAATLLPIAALCALGIRTLAQDRDLERQRLRERLEVAAERVALEIERQLQEVEASLAEGTGIRLLPSGLISGSAQPILYQPESSAPLQTLSNELLVAAQQEFQQDDPASAIAAYRRIVSSTSAPARGDALVALGSLLRRQRRHEEALLVYTDLEQLGMSPVAGGQPAALVARQGRAKALEEMGDEVHLRAEAASLAEALYRGGWPIDRTTFGLYRDMVERWGGVAPAAAGIQRTETAIQLWHAWRRGELAPRGRRFIVDGNAMLASWATGRDGPTVALLTTDQLQNMWRPTHEPHDVDVAILGVDGRPVSGTRRDGAVVLSPADTGLPFVIAVSSSGVTDGTAGRARRGVLIGGLVLAFGLMLTASYGLYRITTRELLLARQQSDFVAAVSHEFRTPLTSMRHLTELLVTRSITSEERKSHYYGLLAHETERLHRMVESLLSFGRIDAGAHAWRLEPVDVCGLVSTLVDEFRGDARGRPVRVEIDAGLPAIQADSEALSRALWNLLENAAKYSEPDAEIRIFARRIGDSVLLGVQDNGVGIPASEQTRVFQKFVRGDEARRAGVRGVGIGLALVTRIMEAHGGSVRLESEVGRGSTFTLVIPCRAS
jgi:signal transduction histidine kinase